jgi:hypothetical protein
VSTDGAAALAAWTMGWRPDDDGVGVMRTDLMLPGGGICRVPDGLDAPLLSARDRVLLLGARLWVALQGWLGVAGSTLPELALVARRGRGT